MNVMCALIKVSSFALTVIRISVLTATKECIDILSAHNTTLKMWTVYLQLLHAMEDSVTLSEDEYNMELSPSLEKSFVDAELIATLAERFQLTSFKRFQKDTIEVMPAGKDTLVLYPTGRGKSLCFQLPPVYLGKKAIIVTPTISLMQDHAGSETQ